MKSKKSGKIISILSSYVVGKYSLLGLTKCMAAELGSFGIRVNSVSPSMVNTPLTDPLHKTIKEVMKSQIPIENRFAEPSEVAEVVLFLCTEGANYITGENILITGGYSMR